MGLLLAGGFIALMLLGMPIGLSIGVASLLVILASELPLEMIPQTMFSGNNSSALVAVPFFILAGDVLSKGGISERIVAFAEAMLGRINGLWTAQNVTGDAIGAALLGGLGAILTPVASASASGWALAIVGVILLGLLTELRRFRQQPVIVEG